MVVEAKDGAFRSVMNGVPLGKALLGERTWSPLTEKTEIREMPGYFVVETFQAKDSDTLRYTKDSIRLGERILSDEDHAYQESINDPDRPWSGKVRWLPSENR